MKVVAILFFLLIAAEASSNESIEACYEQARSLEREGVFEKVEAEVQEEVSRVISSGCKSIKIASETLQVFSENFLGFRRIFLARREKDQSLVLIKRYGADWGTQQFGKAQTGLILIEPWLEKFYASLGRRSTYLFHEQKRPIIIKDLVLGFNGATLSKRGSGLRAALRDYLACLRLEKEQRDEDLKTFGAWLRSQPDAASDLEKLRENKFLKIMLMGDHHFNKNWTFELKTRRWVLVDP